MKGSLTFKPLADGTVQVIIKGSKEDIPELARLYGKEVSITEHREQATVQSPASIMTANAMLKVDELREQLMELHDSINANPTGAGDESAPKEVINEE